MNGMDNQDIKNGFLFRTGLLEPESLSEIQQIKAQAQQHNIETLRVVFADPHGILRGKTIVTEAIDSVFSSGIRVPSTLLLKDTSHRTVFPVWSDTQEAPMHGASDVVLVPVLSTFRILPWSPHSALLHCDLALENGQRIDLSSRQVLANSVAQLAEIGMQAKVGLEVEFQIVSVLNHALEHTDTTMPASPMQTRALNQGYQYLTETRYAEAEEVLDELRRNAQAMSMPVRSVEIEMGPSQFEFTFAPSDPLSIADMAVTFRTLVKELCHRRGLHASFMAKPRLPNAAANGWHIHQSVYDTRTGDNLFTCDTDKQLSATASHWIAGLLDNADAACLMTTPTVNGYKRYSDYQLAPNQIGWANDNRGAMLRSLLSTDSSTSRLENRVADSSANPYFALASQLLCGIDGLEHRKEPPAELTNPYAKKVKALPDNLGESIACFEQSHLFKSRLGDQFVAYMTTLKKAEWNRYLSSVSEWEHAEYFSTF